MWTVRLEAELLTLLDGEDKPVLKLHREEAARYLRFSYDVVRARIVTLVVIEGLKGYSFHCTKVELSKLLSWLPQKSPETIAKEGRYSGLVLALFGTLYLLLPGHLFWGLGVCFLVAGAVGLLLPKRGLYALNGALMILVGLWELLPRNLPGLHSLIATPEERVVPFVVGCVLILWGIQQLTMLGSSQKLRAARAVRDRHASFLPGQSALVRRVGRWNLIASGLFAAYALSALALASAGSATGLLSFALSDAAIYGVLALLAAVSAASFLVRRRPAYLEAKASAQFLIAVAVLSLWGFALSFHPSAPASFLGALLSGEAEVFKRPYVWASLIPPVLLFNRWFARAVDRELEEQRD